MPAVFSTEPSAKNGSYKATNVDSHIENRKTAVLLSTRLGIQHSDHRGDVRFEEAVTGDQ